MDHHRLSRKSIDRLATCEPELHKLAVLALKYSPYDFGITEGVRDIDTQRKYVEEGKSQTMNSRHLPNVNGLSEAFDFCVYGKDGHSSGLLLSLVLISSSADCGSLLRIGHTFS